MHTCYTVTLFLQRLLLVSSIEGVRRSLCSIQGTVYLIQGAIQGTVYLIQGVRRWLWVGCCTYLLARFINEAVRRWFWGIHLLQRLRVPPGCPRLPRMPVVMLLQLGAPTLCLRKRTLQSHLLWVGCRTYWLARFIDEAVRRWLLVGRSLVHPARRYDIMLAQTNTPKPSAVGWTSCVCVGNAVVLL